MKILFAENHKEFAKSVTSLFLCEHQVDVFPTISESIQAISQNSYDAILVDYDLDDGKGTEIVESARESGFDKLIVAVSSHDEGNRLLVRAGASAVCPKLKFKEINDVLGAGAAPEDQ